MTTNIIRHHFSIPLPRQLCVESEAVEAVAPFEYAQKDSTRQPVRIASTKQSKWEKYDDAIRCAR